MAQQKSTSFKNANAHLQFLKNEGRRHKGCDVTLPFETHIEIQVSLNKHFFAGEVEHPGQVPHLQTGQTQALRHSQG